MKLPNRYGTIYKLSGKRRRPYVAKKFVGKRFDSAQKRVKVEYAIIGYYETKQAAIEALSAFNSDPYDLRRRKTTLAEIYSAWYEEHFTKMRNASCYRAAFKVLAPLYETPFNDLTLDTIQRVLDNSGKNKPTLLNVRNLMGMLFEYAQIHSYIPQSRRNVMRHLNVGDSNPNAVTRRIFTHDEIKALWNDLDYLNTLTLVLIFTGMRVSELLNAEDIDLENKVIHITRSKTLSGVRDVPIANCIVPLVQALIEAPTRPYRAVWRDMKRRLNHLPHDTRHTFASLAVEAGIDQRIIDEIIGHSHHNLTLDVYSHISLETKLDAVNKLCVICE